MASGALPADSLLLAEAATDVVEAIVEAVLEVTAARSVVAVSALVSNATGCAATDIAGSHSDAQMSKLRQRSGAANRILVFMCSKGVKLVDRADAESRVMAGPMATIET